MEKKIEEKNSDVKNKNKKNPTHTKVIIKFCVDPTNCPLSLFPINKYEYSLEYIYPSIQLSTQTPCIVDGMNLHFDQVEKNLVDQTFFAIKERRYPINFEKLCERLGYRPDRQEFWERLDHYLKFLVASIRNHEIKNLNDQLNEETIITEFLKVG